MLLVVAWSLFGALLVPLPHDPGLSSLQVQRDGPQLLVHAAFANADFRSAVAIDLDGDGAIDAAELTDARTTLTALVADGFVLHTGTAEGAAPAPRPRLVEARIADNADVELTYAFAAPSGDAALRVDFLRRLAHGHRCYAAVLGSDLTIAADALLAPANATLAVPAVGPTPVTSGFGQAGAFLWLGVEHILLGFDHLAFLLALLVAGTAWRRVVATITAFTAAHSITLLAAALGVVHLPGLLIEATIAASIVVVALANLRARGRAAHRWPLAFGFGLMHGFGFAGVLADLDIGGPGMLLPLLTFNLGVELGQLAFAAVAVPLLIAGTRRFGRSATTVVSLGVGLAGCWWLAERLLGA